MCSDKEILDKRFLLLVNLLWRKKTEEGMRDETEPPGLDDFGNSLL